ncbi:hypothetical protein ACFL6S_20425 [Candidatus Poribacteria bacterium]
MRTLCLISSVFLVLSVSAWAEEEPAPGDMFLLLCDFEDEDALAQWEINNGTPALTSEGVTQGQRALEIRFDPEGSYYGAYLFWNKVQGDWSDYDAAVLDVWNPNPVSIAATLLIADRAWEQKDRSYWNRHNARTTFPPGVSQWVIPVNGLYRGEAGSRNNDIKRNIDPDSIVRLDFGFGQRGLSGRVVIDNFRLIKSGRPDGIWAFDFGPISQPLMPGWTPVAHDTAYASDRGFGWGPEGGTPWNGAARDTTFGTMLLQDFCESGGHNFHVNTAPGRYKVTVFYENSGYWGGEQARQRERRILVNGKEVWSEVHPDGAAHALYRFEDVEPVNVDIWDTYMRYELARPAQFEALADADGLSLRFEADKSWGSKVAALALYKVGDESAEQWFKDQLGLVEAEFRRKAICLDAPASAFDPPTGWEQYGLVVWTVGIEDTVTPDTVPATLTSPEQLSVSRLAVREEYEPFCLAIRPFRDLGECQLKLDPPFPFPAKTQIVYYNTSRGFSNIAYHIRPHTLREKDTVRLPKDVTREIIVTVYVPPDAPAGEHQSTLKLVDADGKMVLDVPLELDVRPVTLSRDTDFLMGYFGLMPSSLVPESQRQEILEQTLEMLREHGMNALSGGPSWQLTGWEDGKPTIDFGDMDSFFALCRKYGFDRPLNGYGGARFRGLHDRYEKGQSGIRVEQESGLNYPEALMSAWRAVDVHARQQDWPTILYAMCDETRVREKAERELEFMQMMAKVSAVFPETVRTSGSYSVNFRTRPDDEDDMLLWHQRFFNALDVNSLNSHDVSAMEEAERLGKEIHIYNQGRTRYSFGLYQWSEFRKGVKARWQWHLNVLHGYQFFDLDGREPDTAMICYGRDTIYPTIHFERCREGAEDFYLYQTLWNLAENRQDSAGKMAAALLEDVVTQVELNQRQSPDSFDADEFKVKVVEAIQTLTQKPFEE